MDLGWAAAGAAAGLLAGAAMRGTVFRLSVPAGAPDRAACPRCSAPVAAAARPPSVPARPGLAAFPGLAARCLRCRARLGHPLALALSTAAVLALLCGRLGLRPELPAFAFLGVLGVALAAIDLAVERLPDRLTLPAYPALGALLVVAAAVGGDGGALLRALLGGLAMGGGYLLLALLRPGQLGEGDVKLAGLAGIALGWLGWPAVLAGATLGFLLFAVVVLVLMLARRITRTSSICFGPFLLGGVLLAILGTP